jgi:hypothetical protein
LGKRSLDGTMHLSPKLTLPFQPQHRQLLATFESIAARHSIDTPE